MSSFVAWCSQNNFELNASKTKELVIDFRRKKGSAFPLIGVTVEMVDS